MSESIFDALPEDRRESAKSAIVTAFENPRVVAIEQITHGASGALIYRIEIGDRPYLLRLENQQRAAGDTRRGYACMRIAADAGIAPPLHYADPDRGVAIMDFLPVQSLFDYPTGREGLVRDLGALAARLQATPGFPAVEDYTVILSGLLNNLIESGIFANGLLEPHRNAFARIVDAYRWDPAKAVASHNDLNPGNIIFDGNRLWLVDWELAFRNDPLIDLANLSNYLAQSPQLQEILLTSWRGRAPDRRLRARLILARQLVRLAYACLTLTVSAGAAGPKPDRDLTAPTLAEFHAMMMQGRLRMGAPESLYLYGKVYLGEFLTNLSAPGFEDAMVIARQYGSGLS